MAWTVLETNANSGAVETEISDFEATEAPDSIDQIDTTKIGRDRVLITVVYTAAA